jgi:hypothetical protein
MATPSVAMLNHCAADLGIPESHSLGGLVLEVEFHNELIPNRLRISDDLRRFLSKVGVDLLKRIRYGNGVVNAQQQTALERDALGYGGHCSLIVTPFGSPSHTLTAFWCPGIFDGQPWLPLFLRRGYRKHLVFG